MWFLLVVVTAIFGLTQAGCGEKKADAPAAEKSEKSDKKDDKADKKDKKKGDHPKGDHPK